MSQPPDVGALRLNDDVDDEYDNIPYNEDEDVDYDMDIDLGPTPSKPSVPRPETSESREAALRKELDSVRQINKVIEDVVQSLEKAKGNMDNVNRTVHSASTLLDTWTRILSQTEHNQRLLLNPNWQGATQDIQDMENESFVRQQQAERRAAEDQARREATQRRAEEEERKKAAPPPATRGSRLRGRVGTASSRLTAQPSSTSSTSSGYVGVGGQGGRGRGVPRAGSSIGSGIGRGSVTSNDEFNRHEQDSENPFMGMISWYKYLLSSSSSLLLFFLHTSAVRTQLVKSSNFELLHPASTNPASYSSRVHERRPNITHRVSNRIQQIFAQSHSHSFRAHHPPQIKELAIMSSYDTATVYTSPEYRHACTLLQRYEYWLSYQTGPDSILICEQDLLDMALTTLSNIMLACQLTCTQRTRATQRAKYVELAIWCHRLERHILTRRARTFIAFAADTGVNVAEIEEAWDMDMEATEALVKRLFVRRNAAEEYVRRNQEQRWRRGLCSQRPRYVDSQPRREVLIEEAIAALSVEETVVIEESFEILSDPISTSTTPTDSSSSTSTSPASSPLSIAYDVDAPKPASS
ncbi:hypothetical protein D6D06_10404 [Aureobasidium pullulans]|nr:hypothetical protein D6D06_10404 [Aureobasidium pullulans]